MIFVDTGAFVARYIERDQYHQRAVALWRTIAQQRHRLYTSNFVLDEVFTLLCRMAGGPFAADRARSIYASQALVILRSDEPTELRALEYLTKFADQRVSFTDCMSFALMKKNHIRSAFTFDDHFARAGFSILPG